MTTRDYEEGKFCAGQDLSAAIEAGVSLGDVVEALEKAEAGGVNQTLSNYRFIRCRLLSLFTKEKSDG